MRHCNPSQHCAGDVYLEQCSDIVTLADLHQALFNKKLSNVTTADFQHAKVSHVRADEQRLTKYR